MDRDPPKLALESALAEIDGLNQQVLAVTEHRSRIMALLTERSREIADLTAELGRSKTDGLRHLEDAQSTARQLRRANEKLVEVTQTKLALENEFHRITDELASLRLELSATKARSTELELEHKTSQSELGRLRQEVDATRRTLEAQTNAWEQERNQLSITMAGLTLEIQSEHHAARVLERRWIQSPAGPSSELQPSREGTGVDLRLAHAESMQLEMVNLREERAELSAKVRGLERDAGASRELARLQQELRTAQVEKKLLERRLENAEVRDLEREELRAKVADLQQNRLDADLARAEVERLRLRLYKAPLHSGTYATHSESNHNELKARDKTDLGAELQNLFLQAGARGVVVADQGGFVVASVGGGPDAEMLAAAAGEADRFSRQTRQLLELAEITQFTLQDRNGAIAHYRFFAIDEDVMSIAVIGPNVPDEGSLDRVVSAVIQQLTSPRERALRIRNSGA
jgi:predicted  nucleic acid-binding Zn-ribbon protein